MMKLRNCCPNISLLLKKKVLKILFLGNNLRFSVNAFLEQVFKTFICTVDPCGNRVIPVPLSE